MTSLFLTAALMLGLGVCLTYIFWFVATDNGLRGRD